MNYVTKEIDGVKYRFAEKIYERMFTTCIVTKMEGGVAMYYYNKIEPYLLYDVSIEEVVEMINNLDEKLITLLVKAGVPIHSLIYTT